MTDKGILVASFGTTKDETRDKTIGALERAITANYPEYRVERAFTSGVVVRRLASRGVVIDTPEQALIRLTKEGVTELYIQPTHLIPGEEYDKLCRAVEPLTSKFSKLLIAKPLLYNTDDFLDVAEAIKAACPTEEDEALLLMGHGTTHFANCVYPAMDFVLKRKIGGHVFMATVEGYPNIEETLDAIQAQGYRRAALLPFMLVAGDHAMNDMAGNEADSWKNLCISRGIEPRCILKGLGECSQARDIYLAHLADCMNS